MTVSVRLDPRLEHQLEVASERLGLSKSEIIKQSAIIPVITIINGSRHSCRVIADNSSRPGWWLPRFITCSISAWTDSLHFSHGPVEGVCT